MKTAVLLCSMGGPDSPQAVRPFLFNLFNDPAILRVPQPFRFMLAALISTLRAKKARAIYEKLGGSSPLLKNTKDQAAALQKALEGYGDFKCFVGMSYWHPFLAEAMTDIKKYTPEWLIVLPLYPQFSTTTTASVFAEVEKQIQKQKMLCPVHKIESFQTDEGFITALCEQIEPVLRQAQKFGNPRLLFSAHGLPEKIVRGGDPYPAQCRETVEAVVKKLARSDLDFILCYQSKVGPMKWIGPSTEDEIIKAAKAKRPIVIVPVAFVSEHSETLVELGVEYRQVALDHGVAFYGVAATVGTNQAFIEGLAQKINQTVAKNEKTDIFSGTKL